MFSTPIVRPMPKISRRSVELGTENAFVVLADIHFGARVAGEGQHIRFSYAASREAIEAGIARMADFIRRNTVRAA